MKLIKKKKNKRDSTERKKNGRWNFFFKENLFALLLNQTRHVNLENS